MLTHGAGTHCDTPLLAIIAATFCHAGFTVLRCNLPFRQARPQGPPTRGSTVLDQQGLHAAVLALRKQMKGRKTAADVFLGGHSYGGRMASMLAADNPGLVNGLLLLSYPLHPPNQPAVLRTAHFSQLQTPSFFVHGTRDGFGSIAEVTAASTLIPAATEVLAIAGADHALIGKKDQQTLATTILDAFQSFHRNAASA